MDLYPSGKTVLATGASTIGCDCGSATAKALAREGVAVAVSARCADTLKALARQIRAAGSIEPVMITADRYDPETPTWLAAEARKHLHRTTR